MLEYTLLWVKPDAFRPTDARESGSELQKPLPIDPEGFMSELRTRILARGLELIEEKTYTVSKDVSGEHYDEHRGVADMHYAGVSKYDFLVGYLSGWPSHWMIVRGEDAIRIGREIIIELREEYLVDRKKARYNMTHGSDSVEGARREILLHFPDFRF